MLIDEDYSDVITRRYRLEEILYDSFIRLCTCI